MPKKFATVEERRAYWKEWYERNKHREDYKAKDYATKVRICKERVDWFTEFKQSLKCCRCDLKDFRVLDFHHRDPKEKDMEVSNLVRLGFAKAKIMKEVEKCDVLCANCHRIVHWEEKNIK